MNKRIFGAWLLGLCAGPACAQQSGVTIYGFLYSGVRYVDNTAGSGLKGLATGPSRLGFRGSEDLGGGSSALFTLESGLDLGSGALRQGGRIFGRQAFVGLSDTRWGTLTAGRQYDFVAQWIAPYVPPGKWNGYMAHVGDNDNTNWSFRINNALKYVSPTVSGFQAGAMLGLGEAPGNFATNKAMSAGLRYEQGPVSVALTYLGIDHPAAAVPEGNWNTKLFPAVTATSQLSASAITPDRMTVSAIAGQYNAGAARLALTYSRSRYLKIGTAVAGLPSSDVSFDNVDANLSYSFTPQWQVGAGYTHTSGEVAATGFSPKYHQLNLMTNYFLSKRTILQLAATQQRAAGDARNGYVLFGSGNASSTRHQTLVAAGIFHAF